MTQPLFMTTLFLGSLLLGVVCLGTVAAVRIFRHEMTDGHASGGGIFLSVFLLALAVRLLAVPRLYHIYFDEFAYLATAQNIFYHGLTAVTLKGSGAFPQILSAFDRPGGWPVLEAVYFFLAGGFGHGQFYLTIFLGSLTAVMACRITWIYTKDRLTSWWAGVFLGLFPSHIKYSACMAADVPGLAFFLLAVLLLSEWYRRPDRVVLGAGLLAAVYSCYIKPVYAGMTLGGAVILIAGICARRNDRKGPLRDIAWVLGCLLLPLLNYIQPTYAREASVAAKTLFSWGAEVKNFPQNINWFFGMARGVPIMGVMLLLGIMSGLGRKRSGFWIMCTAGFVVLFVLTSAYFTGSFSYRQMDRYMFPMLFFMAVLAAGGAVYCSSRLPWLAGAGIFIVLLGNSVLAAAGLVDKNLQRQVHREAAALVEVSRHIPQDVYVLSDDIDFWMTQTANEAVGNETFLKWPPPKVVVFRGLGSFWQDVELQKKVWHVLETRYACRAGAFPVNASVNERLAPLVCRFREKEELPAVPGASSGTTRQGP